MPVQGRKLEIPVIYVTCNDWMLVKMEKKRKAASVLTIFKLDPPPFVFSVDK
jgi:hypothetical protein